MRERLLVVDGDNLVHRYFHNPHPSRPPSEALGFALGRLRKNLAPTHAVVVWDCDGTTWRHQRWPDYKSGRPPRPPELGALFVAARQVCRDNRYAQAKVDNIEADDLIASYTEAGVRAGLDVVILSGDKDLLQLVRETPTTVRMLDEVRRKTWDSVMTHDRWGVWPHSIPDLLALVGDKSDGFPGVPRIGFKTAAPLLELHGGLEQLIDRVELVASKSVRDRLRAHAAEALLFFDLAKLRGDVPLPVRLEGTRWS